MREKHEDTSSSCVLENIFTAKYTGNTGVHKKTDNFKETGKREK